jgi:hypothetical protein
MKSENHFHVHVNVFAISKETRNRLLDCGFFYDPFVFLDRSYAPPEHYSIETTDKQITNAAWDRALKILKADTQFVGYIEQEVLSKKFSVTYDSYQTRKKNYKAQFPLPKLRTCDAPLNKHKRADLHIKRDKSAPRDELDMQLLDSGFYEVWTPRNRIFTLQLEYAKDAKAIFLILKIYFDLVGGIKQLNFEIVSKLVRFPNEFKMAKFLPKQIKSNHYPKSNILKHSHASITV